MLGEIRVDLILPAVGGREHVLLDLMLADHIEQSLYGTVCREKDLTLAVQDELLQIKGDCLGNAAILHLLAHLHLHLLQDPEKMVDGAAAGEYNGCILGNVHTLPAEIAAGNPFHPDERVKL